MNGEYIWIDDHQNNGEEFSTVIHKSENYYNSKQSKNFTIQDYEAGKDVVLALLKRAQEHLDYCNYNGESLERERGEELLYDLNTFFGENK